MDLRINQMNFIDQTVNQTFPGIKKLIPHASGDFSKDKLLDFLEKWWHKNLVLEKPEEKFIEDFKNWAKEVDTILMLIKLNPYTSSQRKVSQLNLLVAHI